MTVIPQAFPGAAVAERRTEYLSAAARVLDSGRYILSDEVAAFEHEFADQVGSSNCVGVANGTDAIEIALRALGIGRGDGVITVSHTAGATVSAIVRTGATPILVDVSEATYTMDPDAVERAISAPPQGVALRAIVPVHLYGLMADMARLMNLARAHGLRVVEDCAQAHGASLQGVNAGRWGDAAAFSFYPTKNLGAIGDGGAIVTDDEALAEAARQLREYGWRERQVVERAGLNSRLDEIQAAFLRVGLSYLERDNNRRIAIADAYDSGLADMGLALPARPIGHRPVFHQYVVRTGGRDSLRAWCDSHGVGTAVHYRLPVHRQPGFESIAVSSGSLTVTEQVVQQIVSLPMYPQLATSDTARVVEVVRAWPGNDG